MVCVQPCSPFFLQDNLPLIVLQVHGPHLLLLLRCQLLLAFRGRCCGVTGRHLPFSATTTPFLPQTENATGLGQGQGQMKASNPQPPVPSCTTGIILATAWQYLAVITQ